MACPLCRSKKSYTLLILNRLKPVFSRSLKRLSCSSWVTASQNFTTTVQSPPDGAAATPVAPDRSPVMLDVGIVDGSVRPTNAKLSAAVGQRVELRVDSDEAGQIRVTTDPARTFELLPQDDQVFGFTADEPGEVTIEVRNPDRTVATVQVGP